MDEIILHHYFNSPFSEKVRVAFGINQAIETIERQTTDNAVRVFGTRIATTL